MKRPEKSGRFRRRSGSLPTKITGIVFWGLVGGCVYLVYRPTGGLRLEEVQEEVHAIEESIEDKA